ncbi:hypothetical protein KAJ83_02465 [Marivibrio halodurans]|uniref:Uncharacterized protein n=1 Tax=Marivibrio halodurans TaxID=2039722 RepID=A0A8J7V117_9PROT|nr:hypothetical protein [Marivibrio halodurans]MBP5855855.1 hypothetical protein [Marivibrio halodurans]
MTASARAIDMLGTLRATERLRGEQAQRALAEADARYGEGSALSTAVKAYVRERTSALGANPETVKAALDHANALARDPKTHAGMRANRTAFNRLTPDQKAAAKATRFEIERERRALMDPAIEAYKALGRTSRGEIARGHGPGNPAPGRQRAFDDKIDALAARIPDLTAREDDLPGVPHPDLDPGLARELGQDAARVLDGRERAADTALDIGMTVAGAAKAAIAFAANGGAKAGAARIVRHATKLVGEVRYAGRLSKAEQPKRFTGGSTARSGKTKMQGIVS